MTVEQVCTTVEGLVVDLKERRELQGGGGNDISRVLVDLKRGSDPWKL